MKVYLIIDVKIKNQEKYFEYIEKAKPIVESFGGKYLVRGGEITPLSGNWKPQRVVIIEFNDIKSLKECFVSKQYLKIKHLREESIVSNSVIVKGIDD